ncbi:MAG: DedA family protein [Candidatus Pacebacteria bacterium]|nr:DedA family protein [Candidatus Paceibacterota bacterium]
MEYLLTILLENAYLSLFLNSFLASTLLPLGSEGILAYFTSQEMNVFTLILIATTGNYLGSVVNYYIGLKGSETILHKSIKFNDIEIKKSKEKFRKFGPAILFFSWVPIIGDPLTFVAGLLKYNFKKFTIYVLLGKAFRYIIVVLITFNVLSL